MRLLVAEDDVRMAAAIRRGLGFEGIVADVAADGEAAIRMLRAVDYDAVVLDVMLPGADGFATCRRLRADAARDAVQDRVRGLDAGGRCRAAPAARGGVGARLRPIVPAQRRSAQRAATPR